jgi:predicted transcriptional regulator of viral defense system
MRWTEFTEKVERVVKNVPFTVEQIGVYFPHDDYKSIRQNLYNWQKKGKIIKLRRNLYLIAQKDIDLMLVANKLYEPSYISLEYGLSFYGLIPEVAFQVTSITTRKTKQFKNKLGSFIYKHIKKELYFGFRYSEGILIAEPEKCLLDYFYLNSERLRFETNYLRELRLQNLDKLDVKKLKKYSKIFGKKISEFCEFLIKHETDY